MCISCVLLLPRLELLVFYSVLGGRAYLRMFWRFDSKRIFRVLPMKRMMFYVFSCQVYSCFTVFSRHLWFLVKNLALSHRHAFLRRPMCISCVLLLTRLDLLVFYCVLEGRAYLRIFVDDSTQNGVFENCSWICMIFSFFVHIFGIFMFSTRCSDTIPRVL